MERTVPTTETQEIELYLRTYYSLLRSTADVQIRTLEEVHATMNSLLHPGARSPRPDMSAFIYSILRLPPVMDKVALVVLGQSEDVFARGGYGDVYSWQEVTAPARRRRTFFDGKSTLACFIASRSDIDDIIPILTAYQIEWNKLHRLLRDIVDDVNLEEMCRSVSGCEKLADLMQISHDDFDRLYAIWDVEVGRFLQQVAKKELGIRVKLLSGSLSEYRRATHAWWHQIQRTVPYLNERPVYFISSNTHSIPNLLSGFALQKREELVRYLEGSGLTGLLNEWRAIQSGETPSSEENFLYYLMKKYQQTEEGRALVREQLDWENSLGITRIPSQRFFDIEAQVIEISRLKPEAFDPRLQNGHAGQYESLSRSDALIVNVDYPLGLAAYNILTEVADHVGKVLGVYVMGKAATLNGVIGDVMIPNVVHDEHSQNTYLFPNCFTAADVAPNLIFGTVLDNQKAVTVQGTYLQNADFMSVFYREGFSSLEMEAGPYLSGVYEMARPTRHPVNEIVNLYGIPFDLGIAHYASDTPLSKGKNLGAGSLSYYGMDSTYAVSLAILRRVLACERQRLGR